MNENNIMWLCKWYSDNCDGDWEHQNGILIEIIDNPGWNVTINLKQDFMHAKDVAWNYQETTSDDWFGYKIEDGVFDASGDSAKLDFLIGLFKKLVLDGIINSE